MRLASRQGERFHHLTQDAFGFANAEIALCIRQHVVPDLGEVARYRLG